MRKTNIQNMSALKKATNNFKKETVLQQVSITPAMAEKLLLLNKSNRPFHNSNLKMLIAEMQNNKWQYNGDSIRFSNEGELIDGQHRLKAAAMSGKSFVTNIVSGLNKASFSVIDVGAKRNATDTVATMGFKHQTVFGSLCRWIKTYNKNNSVLEVAHNSGRGTNTELVEFINSLTKKEVANLQEISLKSSSLYRNFRLISETQYAFFYYILQKQNAAKVEQFMNLLSTGEGVSSKSNSSIYQLRKLIINGQTMSSKMSNVYKYALIIKAWNSFISSNQTARNVNWKEGMEFPKLR